MWFKKTDLGRWRGEVQALHDEIKQLKTALLEATDRAMSKAAAPHDADANLRLGEMVTKLLDVNERLSAKFYSVWQDERATIRAQRVEAAKKSVEARAERAAVKAAEPLGSLTPPVLDSKEIPMQFLNCEECLATLEGRAPSHNNDMLNHARHKTDFWSLLQRNGGSAPTA